MFMDYDNYNLNYSYREKLIGDIKDSGEIIQFNEEELIEFEFKKLDYFYLIIEGKVKQYFIDKNGDKRTILILSKGDVFGEVTMLQGAYDRVITNAYTKTKVCKISKKTFDSFLKKNPEIYKNMLIASTTKIKILMDQIYDITYSDAKKRVYFLLKRLSMQHGIDIEDGVAIDLKLTHEDIGYMVGSTRSTVTKIINELEKENKIMRTNRKLIVL